jgi:DNA-binding NtrC family response regulator
MLVVEDSASVTRVLRALLEDEGFYLLCAPTVADGVAVLHTTAVDLVLTDGFSQRPQGVLDSIAPLLAAAGRTPVVLMTGHRIALADAQARGICAVIPKPFDIDQLVAQVRSCFPLVGSDADGGRVPA